MEHPAKKAKVEGSNPTKRKLFFFSREYKMPLHDWDKEHRHRAELNYYRGNDGDCLGKYQYYAHETYPDAKWVEDEHGVFYDIGDVELPAYAPVTPRVHDPDLTKDRPSKSVGVFTKL
jgi:hypothetical protein